MYGLSGLVRSNTQGSKLRPIRSHLRLNFTSLRLEKREYRIYSNKRRGAYLIFRATSAALIRGRRLFRHCTRQICTSGIYSHRYNKKLTNLWSPSGSPYLSILRHTKANLSLENFKMATSERNRPTMHGKSLSIEYVMYVYGLCLFYIIFRLEIYILRLIVTI